jgi:hypothetical protein
LAAAAPPLRIVESIDDHGGARCMFKMVRMDTPDDDDDDDEADDEDDDDGDDSELGTAAASMCSTSGGASCA